MRTRRLLSIVALGVVPLLAGTACSSKSGGDAAAKAADSATTATTAPAVTGPQTYNLVIDGPSTLGAENYVFGAFFPKTIAARPGDTLVFQNRSSNDIHTVTFGVKADRSDSPPPVTKTVQANPAVFGPCYTAQAAGPGLVSCPTAPAKGAAAPEYSGQGYWNSGQLLFPMAPPEAGPKTATVKLGAGIAPGSYTITCLLHAFMQSTLNVVKSDAERLSPAQVSAAADKELGEARAQAPGLAAPPPATTANGAGVVASWGNQLITVNRFSPETVSIKVGQTVKWTDASPYMPHTVSFQPPFKSPDEPNAFLPTGAKSGSNFAGGVAHSGMIGPKPLLPVDSFSLTFTKAGTYPYLCLLHPGMAGTVQVS
jgi:plastocyanin